MATKIGCRPPWDTWSPDTIPVCHTLEQLQQHETMDWGLYTHEKKVVKNNTGCLIPCTYREYKQVGIHREGSTDRLPKNVR